jgi:hypothetical protein
MAKSQVRRIVIRECMSLARDKRGTDNQAVAFANTVVQRSILRAGRRGLPKPPENPTPRARARERLVALIRRRCLGL